MAYCSHCKTLYAQGERYCPVDGSAILDEDVDRENDPLIGRKVAHRYFIKRQIGRGGMGVVYEAEHVGLDKRVALKFILDKYTEDRDVVMRFHREARTASRIGHDHIVDITDIDETEDGRHFIVMEYLEGADLSAVLKRERQLPPQRALNIVSQVLSGLGAAHSKGVVHRDMKPENVFLSQSETKGGDFAKIMDFGISKFIRAHDSRVRLTQTGAVVGTPIYMAPEQASAAEDVDHRVDLYAVGVMLFEMLCGRPPFLAASYLGLVTQHLHEQPPRMRSIRPELSEALDAAVLRALEKDPGRRYASADEFRRALAGTGALLGDPLTPLAPPDASSPRYAPTLPHTAPAPQAFAMVSLSPGMTAPTAPATPTARRASSPRWQLVAGIAGVAAVATVAAAIVISQSRRDSTPAARSAPAASISAPTRPAVAAEAMAPDGGVPVVTELSSFLELNSQPEQATVFVDGTQRGRTPIRLELSPGNYAVRLERQGYETLDVTKQVRAGYTETFFAAMAPSGSGRRANTRSDRRRSDRTGRSTATDERAPTSADPQTSRGREPAAKQPPAESTAPVKKTPDKKSTTGSKPSPYIQTEN